MNKQLLIDTVRQLLAGDKGLLAMDESNNTCNKRFAALGIPQTEGARRSFREWIVTTPGLNESISGAILFDETIRQQTKDGIPLTEVLEKAGIIPGIKVDMGAKPMAGFPNEKITEGLDGLRNRLEEYAKMGARFAKWRAVITIGDGIPTDTCIDANASANLIKIFMGEAHSFVSFFASFFLKSRDRSLFLKRLSTVRFIE